MYDPKCSDRFYKKPIGPTGLKIETRLIIQGWASIFKKINSLALIVTELEAF